MKWAQKLDHKLRCIMEQIAQDVEGRFNGRGSGVDEHWVAATVQTHSVFPIPWSSDWDQPFLLWKHFDKK